MSASVNTFLTDEEVQAEQAATQAYNDLLGEKIQSLKDLVGPNIKVTLTNEFGASMTY
jgi:hypothetical protein